MSTGCTIVEKGILPVSALSTLSMNQARFLLMKGTVHNQPVCKFFIPHNPLLSSLHRLRLSEHKLHPPMMFEQQQTLAAPPGALSDPSSRVSSTSTMHCCKHLHTNDV